MEISSTSLTGLRPQRPDPAQMFRKADADGIGAITKQELTDALAALPKPPGVGQAPGADTLFSKMDADGNGEVSEGEHTKFLETAHANRGGGPAPASDGFDGSSEILAKLLAALKERDAEASPGDLDELLASFVEQLRDGDTTYGADGSASAAGPRPLFETDV